MLKRLCGIGIVFFSLVLEAAMEEDTWNVGLMNRYAPAWHPLQVWDALKALNSLPPALRPGVATLAEKYCAPHIDHSVVPLDGAQPCPENPVFSRAYLLQGFAKTAAEGDLKSFQQMLELIENKQGGTQLTGQEVCSLFHLNKAWALKATASVFVHTQISLEDWTPALIRASCYKVSDAERGWFLQELESRVKQGTPITLQVMVDLIYAPQCLGRRGIAPLTSSLRGSRPGEGN